MKLVTYAVFGALNWIANWYDPAGPNTPDEIADQFLQLVMQGLQPRP